MSSDAQRGAELQDALAELNLALRTHGGAVECVGVRNGTLRLRMTGLCSGCLFKPVTLAATIAPYIQERLGMEVEIEGGRVSAEASERLARALSHSYEPLSLAARPATAAPSPAAAS